MATIGKKYKYVNELKDIGCSESLGRYYTVQKRLKNQIPFAGAADWAAPKPEPGRHRLGHRRRRIRPWCAAAQGGLGDRNPRSRSAGAVPVLFQAVRQSTPVPAALARAKETSRAHPGKHTVNPISNTQICMHQILTNRL